MVASRKNMGYWNDQGLHVKNALSGQSNDGITKPLSPASLVVLDRFVDLHTPSSCSGVDNPLAHRIINTIRHYQHSNPVNILESKGIHSNISDVTEMFCEVTGSQPLSTKSGAIGDLMRRAGLHKSEDITLIEKNILIPASLEEASVVVGLRGNTLDSKSTDSDKVSNLSIPPLLLPMSGVSGLNLPYIPSLLLSSGSDHQFDKVSIKKILQSVVFDGEEYAATVLCKELKVIIDSLEGKVAQAKKKRGLGAEVLANVQALVNSYNAKGIETIDKKWEMLLRLSLAVVEAMQRSSSKQFINICSWQCCYDVRAIREKDFERIVHDNSDDLEVCFTHLNNYFVKISRNEQSQEPLDIIFILTQLIR